jgi:hypothetical protein
MFELHSKEVGLDKSTGVVVLYYECSVHVCGKNVFLSVADYNFDLKNLYNFL